MAFYFLLSGRKDIRVIPATLCLIAFLASFGPWGSFAVSEGSQIARLERLLTANGMLAGGAIRRPARPPSFEDSKQISAAVKYLNDVHGLAGLEPWFGRRLEMAHPGP